MDEGMSMMTNVVFEQDSGPGVEVEQISKSREFSGTRNADKSARKARLDAQTSSPARQADQ